MVYFMAQFPMTTIMLLHIFSSSFKQKIFAYTFTY